MPTSDQIEKAARAGDPEAFRRMVSAFEMAEKWRDVLDLETNADDRDCIAKMMADCERKGTSAKEKLFEKYGKALSAAEPVKVRVKHKKRGSTYEVIGTGKMQAENWWERNPNRGQATFNEFDQTVDMREVVIYRSEEDGSFWVRPVEEFNDARFAPLPAVRSALEGA